MERFLQIKTPEQLSRVEGLAALPPMNPDDLVRHAPNEHWVLLDVDGKAAARCSLWWQRVPALPGHRLGLIGHYAANDTRAAGVLLSHGCAQLSAHGCTLVVGPMDGSTWRRYRLITERGSEPQFFLEPDNPDDWPRHFSENGFSALATYTSGLNADLSQEDPRIQRAGERFASMGIRFRPLDSERFEEELRHIYSVSEISFRNNFLYTPISEAEFVAQYRLVQSHLRRELITIAELEGRAVGFIFAIPDLLQARRGQPIDTAIVKTVAVLPDRAHAGLGTYLVAQSQITARELGYKRVIHALMHESNTSRNISGHYAQVMRRYTLFAKAL